MNPRYIRPLLALCALVAPGGIGCAPRVAGDHAEVRHDGTTYVLAPNVSHSRGVEGGVVLLWPRVIPSAETERLRPIAAALQERLLGLAQTAMPGRPIDRRPEPERVCPPNGCLGVSVGVLLAVRGESCFAVALVSAPGRAPQHLTPWAGTISADPEVPFREHPESFVRIQDFVPCSTLLEAAHDRDERVRASMESVVGAK